MDRYVEHFLCLIEEVFFASTGPNQPVDPFEPTASGNQQTRRVERGTTVSPEATPIGALREFFKEKLPVVINEQGFRQCCLRDISRFGKKRKHDGMATS
jgi:hypothetical protein